MQQNLLAAIEAGDPDAARRAVAGGADIQQPGEHGRTPLHRAAYVAPVEMVEWLLSLGADANARDADGRTPLHFAISGDTTLRLIDAGADPHAEDLAGTTPLHTAAELQQPGTAQRLLEAGATVDALNHAGLTPLHFSALQGTRAVATLLLGRGADIDARTRDDFSYRWTYLAPDVQGMDYPVRAGSTAVMIARKRHRENRMSSGRYGEFADWLVSRGAIEPPWWKFWERGTR